MFEAGEFDVATLFYSRFKSVIAQVPTAQAADPGQWSTATPRRSI
jgi:F-type H+-transporting ATPase subunit gamma